MTDTIYNAIIAVLFDMNNCTLRQSSLIPGWLSQGGEKAHPESSEISETLRKTILGGDQVIRYNIGDDGQYDGTYDLEDSLNVCQFPHKPTVVGYSPKIKAKAEDEKPSIATANLDAEKDAALMRMAAAAKARAEAEAKAREEKAKAKAEGRDQRTERPAKPQQNQQNNNQNQNQNRKNSERNF